MPSSNEFFDVQDYGPLGVLLVKPNRGMALSQISYSHAVLDAIKGFEAEAKSVLLVRVPSGNFAPDRMESFWQAANQGKLDDRHQGAQFCRVTNLPLDVLRFETGIVQLLKLLQTVNLFKIIAVEGDVDFTMVGLLLACDVRFCSRTTMFENRLLDRCLPPGFGVLWQLVRQLGQPAAVDLVLNHRSIDAQEALRLKLVTHLADEASLTEEAVRFAKSVAEKPAPLLKALAKATNFASWDFETYLEQFGGGSGRGR